MNLQDTENLNSQAQAKQWSGWVTSALLEIFGTNYNSRVTGTTNDHEHRFEITSLHGGVAWKVEVRRRFGGMYHGRPAGIAFVKVDNRDYSKDPQAIIRKVNTQVIEKRLYKFITELDEEGLLRAASQKRKDEAQTDLNSALETILSHLNNSSLPRTRWERGINEGHSSRTRYVFEAHDGPTGLPLSGVQIQYEPGKGTYKFKLTVESEGTTTLTDLLKQL